MITMGILKKWATDTLKNSTEFQAICTSTIGAQLNYYRSAPMDRPAETLPYLTAYSDEYEQDDQSDQFWNVTWVIPIAIAIECVDDFETDADVSVWTSTDKVEILAMSAKEILKTEANGCGIQGEDLRVIRSNLIVTEIGQADDVQANLFITLGKTNSI